MTTGLGLDRVKLSRLLSWKVDRERAIIQKESVMSQHRPGTSYHTTAMRSRDTHQRALDEINAALERRG